jgi:hypothetical protein
MSIVDTPQTSPKSLDRTPHRRAATSLILVGALFGELISAHQSPLSFFNPLSFVLTALPYGFGALLCRELLVRWKKGALSLVFLGLAYGLYEEAIVVRSMFDAQWLELADIGPYIFLYHWMGINWTYGVMLLHFHITVSIMASVLFVEIKNPTIRHEPWVSPRGLFLCGLGLLYWLPVGFLLLKPHFYPWDKLALSVCLIIGLMIAARYVPNDVFKRFFLASNPNLFPRHVPPVVFFLIGFLNTAAIFFTIVLTATCGQPSLIWTIVLLLGMEGLSFWVIWHCTASGTVWFAAQQFASLAGIMGFYIVFCFLKGIEEDPTFLLVGVFSVVWFWKTWQHVPK